MVAENSGAVKAATWRAAAERAAAREARRQAAIRRARESTTVAGALRLARLTRRLTPAAYARLTREHALARAALNRLSGARASELGSVLATVDQLAAQRLLSHDRLEPVFLVLRRNRELWTRAPMPAPGERRTFGRDPAVFQYYPGRGIQLQPLASWGAVNWLAGSCLKGWCPVKRLRRAVERLAGLAANRGPFLAWEHYFAWGGGTAPWISGMTQATAVSALARAGRALHEPRWHRVAHRALGAFQAPPPLGVDGGDHFLMYSFAPSLRIFNGELQAVSGVGEVARYARDRTAQAAVPARRAADAADGGRRRHRGVVALLGRGSRGDAELSPADRPVPREHVRADRAAHVLRGRPALRPLRARADPHRRRAAAAAARPPRDHRALLDLQGLVGQGPRLRPPRARLQPRARAALRRAPGRLDAARARAATGCASRRRGPSGPVGIASRRVAVRLPKPKPKKERRKGDRGGPRSATPGKDRKEAPKDEVLTPRTEREKVSS